MFVKNVMTKEVVFISPKETVTQAAALMKKLNVGALPVGENDRLVGMVTDRDLVTRTLATGQNPKAQLVGQVMTSPITYCFEDQTVEEIARLMEVRQIRRLVVLNGNKRMVGIVSLGDVACKGQNEELSGEMLEKISEPAKVKAA